MSSYQTKRSTTQPTRQASTKQASGVQGEGDYASAKHYNDQTRAFVKSGKVEEAAHNAAPHNAAEAAALREAEAAGRERSKGEAPSDIRKPAVKRAPGKHPSGKPVPEKAPGR